MVGEDGGDMESARAEAEEREGEMSGEVAGVEITAFTVAKPAEAGLAHGERW